MTLATATTDGRPSARVVLLKGVDADGFVFFTNYTSHKGYQIDANPWAALVFWWDVLERQVRVEGTVLRVGPEASDAYFQSRPRGSRLGAWASPQSQPITDRDVLERNLADMEARFAEQEVPRPPHWGGFCLEPVAIEFWQGRPSRLHDRLRYTRAENAPWHIERLAP
jgi:pyridoxamine 5'-phosphate oxidase